MSLPGESAGHAARRGDPGHSGPGEELGEGGPVLGRTEQPRGLETALLPPQDREQSLPGQTLHQHIAVEGGELQLPVLPQGAKMVQHVKITSDPLWGKCVPRIDF